MTKRNQMLVAVLVIVILTAAIGWTLVSRIESPAEVAARTKPPEPSPILVPAEMRVLRSEIITRGTGRFGLPQTVSIAPSTLKGEAGLITTLPRPNAQLHEGSVLLTASGRPVLLVQGGTPAYRDLVPGISGEDVRQLQEALRRLGHLPRVLSGVYDEATADAVQAWYVAGGWEPFGPTKEQVTALRALQREQALAEKEHSAAIAAVAAAARGVESAQARAEHELSAAEAELATRRAERDRIVLDPRQTKAAREAAEAGLKQAEAGVRSAKLAGESAVQEARENQRLAKLDATLASESLARANEELQRVESRLGTQIPVDEIVFLPSLPVRVHELVVNVGDPARGPVLSVTDNQLVIDSALPLDAASLVRVGMPVRIDEQAIGIKASGSISMIAPTSGTHGADAYHIHFEVRVEKTSTPLNNFSVRLTIPVESTEGPVLAVPLSALSLAPDGSSRLQVQKESGTLEYVAVDPGMSADGFVQVTPVGGALDPGQLVVIGYERP